MQKGVIVSGGKTNRQHKERKGSYKNTLEARETNYVKIDEEPPS